MDDCIRSGVATSEKTLPGRLGLQRRAPMLYRRLMRGYPFHSIYFRVLLTDRPSLLVFLKKKLAIFVARFYPGIAGPTMPAIAAGAQAVGELDAPSDMAPQPQPQPQQEQEAGAASYLGSGATSRRVTASRPTRVVGSLDHPVLPMPPVRLSLSLQT